MAIDLVTIAEGALSAGRRALLAGWAGGGVTLVGGDEVSGGCAAAEGLDEGMVGKLLQLHCLQLAGLGG